MDRFRSRGLLLVGAACCLAACGGGGGSGTAEFAAIPPPPPSFVKIFPNITETTDFATLGYELGAQAPIGDGFSVRYDAVQQAYIIDTPFFAPGKFGVTSENGTSWSSDSFATVLKPSPANPNSSFEHTTFASYISCSFGCYSLGVFAFGTQTPQSQVPTAGTANYDALLNGLDLDSGVIVGGTALLQFNFSAGTLSGALHPILDPGGTATNLGQYNFVNTVFGVGSQTFSGDLQHSTVNGLGTFSGLFTGPAAQELMARWRAPYIPQGGTAPSEVFGVLFARKCC